MADAARNIDPDPYGHGSDFNVWATEQARLLRTRQLSHIDIDHIAEEITALAGAERRALRNHLAIVIEHLLKLEHSPAVDPRSKWRVTVERARGDVRDILDSSPSLRAQIDKLLAEAHRYGANDASLSLMRRDNFSEAQTRPVEARRYTLDQVLGDWLPPEPDR